MIRSGIELDTIGVRFATFRDASVGERESLATRLDNQAATEWVLLSTCHRVELVTVGAAGGSDLRGRAAVHRLFDVVAGFDSAIIAEEQLLGQVRAAYERALAAGQTGPILNELFRRALRFGRRVRSHARPGTDRSLADPGLAWLKADLPPAPAVAVVGTGEMGWAVAVRLAGDGCRVVVVSRSAERGDRLREALPGDGHGVVVGEPDATLVDSVDAIVLAVRARQPVLTAEHLGEARPRTLDLSAPSAVAEDARTRLGDRLLSIDQIRQPADAPAILEPGTERRLRGELEAELDRFETWLAARRGRDALAVLHAEADAVRQRHVTRLRKRAGLDDAQLAAVESATSAMLGELLHGPSLELRRGGVDAAAVRRLFGLDT